MSFTDSTVHTENCSLHYCSIGTGAQLFTFIPGGNGHAQQYYKMMEALAADENGTKYTCVTFDRRQMTGSPMDGGVVNNKPISLAQQARDVIAVIKAMGFSKSIVFGNSLGALIGFQVASDYPSMVTHLIAHEGPSQALLPNAEEMRQHLRNCNDAYRQGGLDAAFKIFTFTGYDDPAVPQTGYNGMENQISFWEHEFPELIDFDIMPMMERLKSNGTSMLLMEGKRSKGAWYAQCVGTQQKFFGCEKMIVPGHHQGFEVETELFLPALRDAVKLLEEKKEESE